MDGRRKQESSDGKYMYAAEAAEQWGVTVRQVQKLCKSGAIAGAVKDERDRWLLPVWTHMPSTSYTLRRDVCVIREDAARPLPLGISSYKRVAREYYYIDKTLMIRDILDIRPQAVLFARPRRFGKTLNMDMLRTFFEKSGEDTSVYFKDKAIWRCGEYYRAYQGRYPVIFLTFKDAKYGTWEDTFLQMKSVIRMEFSRHRELKDHPALSEYEKTYYRQIVAGEAREVEWAGALGMLSAMLSAVYDEDPVIIIDEYDTPIQEGYAQGFYEQVIRFMRNFFSSGLKDNPRLSFAFMTGILRVAKESIFSGMNNLKVYSVLDEPFSEYFGFTEEEIRQMTRYYGAEDHFEEIRDWYDGYRFGGTEVYNPWSVVNYFTDQCRPKAFWQSTGSNEIIREILEEATPEIIRDLERLLQQETVPAYVDTGVIYPEIRRNPSSIFSFLLIAGYLRCEEVRMTEDGAYLCAVRIPNREIRFVYEREILEKYGEIISPAVSITIRQALCQADADLLQKELHRLLLQSASYFDTSHESFYQGLMLGLCTVLSSQYQILSNREGGTGRFDVLMRPKDRRLPGIVMEFKVAEKGSTEEQMQKLAQDALRQIEDREYDVELREMGCGRILRFGIAFCRKRVAVAHR